MKNILDTIGNLIQYIDLPYKISQDFLDRQF